MTESGLTLKPVKFQNLLFQLLRYAAEKNRMVVVEGEARGAGSD